MVDQEQKIPDVPAVTPSILDLPQGAVRSPASAAIAAFAAFAGRAAARAGPPCAGLLRVFATPCEVRSVSFESLME